MLVKVRKLTGASQNTGLAYENRNEKRGRKSKLSNKLKGKCMVEKSDFRGLSRISGKCDEQNRQHHYGNIDKTKENMLRDFDLLHRMLVKVSKQDEKAPGVH